MQYEISNQLKHLQAIYNCLHLVHEKLLKIEQAHINKKHKRTIESSTVILGVSLNKLENQILKLKVIEYQKAKTKLKKSTEILICNICKNKKGL